MTKVKLSELVNKELCLKNGRINLYHYSDTNLGNNTILDPIKSSKNKKSYSGNDYKLSKMPRVWYYLDAKDVEPSVKSPYLYKITTDGSNILDLASAKRMYDTDNGDLKINYPRSYSVMKKSHNEYGILNFESLFKNVKKLGFDGLYYEAGGIKMVTMFTPESAKIVRNIS